MIIFVSDITRCPSTNLTTMRKFATIILALICCVFHNSAEISRHVQWTSEVKNGRGGDMITVVLHGRIDGGWHVYGTDIAPGGPTPLSVEWTALDGAKPVGKLQSHPAAHTEYDDMFEMDLSWWENEVTLTQVFNVTAEKYKIGGNIRFMTCNNRECNAPTTEPVTITGSATINRNENETDEDNKDGKDSAIAEASADSTLSEPAVETDLWAPVTYDDGQAPITGGSRSGSSLWLIFFACFLGGLMALLTPCVWPIIPLTVSFFLKKSDNRRSAVAGAVTYGASIIVIYLLLGLLVTAIFGADALNNLATNAICNIIFFLLLVVFAISFFGAFDIKLPQSWSNRMDRNAERTTGALSIFFMAFTLVIVSFSCTGPIIGTLLVEAASSGSKMAPALGMLGFALALAIPFTLFAMFPSWLKQLPRSGSWLNTVKVLLGFVELALSLKFLSVADLAYGWHILDREVFLALWIVIFGLMGFYLLGLFRFKGDGDASAIGVTRFFLALASLAFAIYLIPGLWGAPLRATSAFVPPLSTQDFNLYADDSVTYDDYDRAMTAAQRLGKPVFVDFSGYGCVNCRKMEGAVLDRDDVKRYIRDNFVTVRLMVDDRAELEKPYHVMENGKAVELRTVGDKWSYLQRHKFNSNSQPFYVVLSPDGRLASGPVAYDEDVVRFMDFLSRGKEAK